MAENARVERIAQFGGADLRAIKTGLGRCHHDRPRYAGCGRHYYCLALNCL
jgi:hypothetical protein